MESDAEQAIGTAGAENLRGEVGEHGLRVATNSLFHEPDHSGLMRHQEALRKTRDLAEPHQARLNTARHAA